MRLDPVALAAKLKVWGAELGFGQIGITGIDLARDEQRLRDWLGRQYHGEMAWLAAHGNKRSRPAELVPDTLSVICARLDYLPESAAQMQAQIDDPNAAYISRYALGRDYHKVMRGRLRRLARRLEDLIGPFGHRVFSDSAPVLEKPLARNAGLGWIGKHTNLINRDDGSWFFLGEIYTDIALPADAPLTTEHCGSCTRCIEVCPTAAIIAPFVLDARRCISYLTIELKTAIPVELRPLIGNRIYGCDDCQIHCPWNRYARLSVEPDFQARHGLQRASLLSLFAWDEQTFQAHTEGSALRRASFEQWQRNLAVALGNAPPAKAVIRALEGRREQATPLVREHIDWALARQRAGLLENLG
ncbi:MAG: tRNA epoxyqueuosine(34) reductase QueG [Gammaproteobacteria bacterium]|nr:tRNA epoxyqueuosine(34) reductase QueG [Gammaproteobacteria bacterium]